MNALDSLYYLNVSTVNAGLTTKYDRDVLSLDYRLVLLDTL